MQQLEAENGGYIAIGGLLKRFPVTRLTLSNWMTSESFPQPALRVGGRRLWSIADVLRWEEQKANDKRVAA